MTVIRVNMSKINSAANTVDAYVEKQKKAMKTMGSEVTGISKDWGGNDYDAFIIQWAKLTAKDGTFEKMIRDLTNYAENLRHARKLYYDAQTRALARAKVLKILN